MNRIGLLIIKDVKLALQGASDTGMTFVFLLLACTLFQFSIGPDQTLLIKVGGGVIWVVALLATILSLERLFITDFEDGTLEQYFLSPMSLVFFALAKAISHWLTTGLLVIISAPIIALLYSLPSEVFLPLFLSMVIGTPILSLIGTLGAALTLGAKRSGVLMPLIILPLYIPVLIFGTLVIYNVMYGHNYNSFLIVLIGLLLLSLALAPWATACALRQAIE